MLVGGSALYVRAVLDELRLPRHRPGGPGAPRGRAGRASAPAALHARLADVDPAAAAAILPTQRPAGRARARGRASSPAGRSRRRCRRRTYAYPATPCRSGWSVPRAVLDARGSPRGSTRCGPPAWSTRCAGWSGAGLRDGPHRQPGARLRAGAAATSPGSAPRRRPASETVRATRRFARRQDSLVPARPAGRAGCRTTRRTWSSARSATWPMRVDGVARVRGSGCPHDAPTPPDPPERHRVAVAGPPSSPASLAARAGRRCRRAALVSRAATGAGRRPRRDRSRTRSPSAAAAPCPPSTRTPPGSGLDVLRGAATRSTRPSPTAAALGVTEPYSAGIGGGGYFVVLRRRAPARCTRSTVARPRRRRCRRTPSSTRTATPIPFAEAVTSGLSVGVPGTPADLADRALDRWGTLGLAGGAARRPLGSPRGLRRRRDVPQQTADNEAPVRRLHLDPRPVPARRRRRRRSARVFRNPDLADTYDAARRRGVDCALRRPARPARSSPRSQAPAGRARTPTAGRPAGLMACRDLARLHGAAPRADPGRLPRPRRRTAWRPPSSGGSTVGEALNILERR